MTPTVIASGPASAALAIGMESRGSIQDVSFRIPTSLFEMDDVSKIGCILSL
jgi:hypothetical protein